MTDQTAAENPKMLDIDHILHALRQAAIGHTIVYHQSVASTMPIAHELAKRPSTRSGTLVVAEEQTAGRGRLDRNWQAAPGSSLLCSLILKEDLLPSQPSLLVMAAGVAIVNALTTLQPTLSALCGLKWPNDVLLGYDKQAAQKVSGILIESQLQGSQLSHAVIGFGINVNQTEQELPSLPGNSLQPTSIYSFTGKPLDRAALFIELARQWEKLLKQSWQDPTSIFQQWRSTLWTIGQDIAVHNQGVLLCSGLALDAEADGALLVKTEKGTIQRVHMGDVSLRAT